MTTPFQPLPCDGGGGGDESPGASGCCSPSIAAGRVCLPDGTPILLVLRTECADCAGGAADPEVAGWVDPTTGAFTAGQPPAGTGPCEEGCGAVTTVPLCDRLPDGTCVAFLRRLVHDCDGAVTAVSDTALDGMTAYAVQGEAGDCSSCDPCEPVEMCPQLLGLSGPESWVMPDGAESVSLSVVCGPITVTDCAGNATVINECGVNLHWSAPAPASGCEPGRLCAPFTIDVADGAAVYVNFLTPCAGDQS